MFGNLNLAALVPNGSMIMFAAGVILAAILCLFGLKMMRLLGAITGMALGAGVGFLLYAQFGLDMLTGKVIMLLGAVLMAILFVVVRKLGYFAFCMLGAFWVLKTFINCENWILVAVCAALALIVGILAMIYLEPVMIVVTSAAGALIALFAAKAYLGVTNVFILLAIAIVALIIGLCTQFMVKSREIGRKEVKKADIIRDEISMESEVDKARAILEDDDDEDDDDEDEPVSAVPSDKKKEAEDPAGSKKEESKKKPEEKKAEEKDTKEKETEPKKEVKAEVKSEVKEEVELEEVEEGYNDEDDDVLDDDDFQVIDLSDD